MDRHGTRRRIFNRIAAKVGKSGVAATSEAYIERRGVNFIDAYIDRRDSLFNFKISTTSREKGSLRGRTAFKRAWDHLGHKAKGIQGTWLNTPKFADNLITFNRSVRNGNSLEDAAFTTFTGKMARERGFTEVVVKTGPGTPGNYLEVFAVFTRPGA